MRIAAKQIQIIKMAQRDLGIEDADYRALLSDLFGVKVTSSKQLSIEQANRLIDEFQKKGWQLKAKDPSVRAAGAKKPVRAKGKNVVHLANAGELAKVAALAALIPWRAADGFSLFLRKRCQVRSGKVRTSQEAYLAIEALKKYYFNLMTKAHGPSWWTIPFDDPAIERFIFNHAPAEDRDPVTGKVWKRVIV